MSKREDARADQHEIPEGIGRRTVIGRSLGVALAGSVLGVTRPSAAAVTKGDAGRRGCGGRHHALAS